VLYRSKGLDWLLGAVVLHTPLVLEHALAMKTDGTIAWESYVTT